MPRRRKPRLPDELFVIPNKDKLFHEKWSKKRNRLNFPHPWRAVFLGPPNSGKTLAIMHLVLRAKPQFEEVFCVHCDANYTKEYDDMGATMLEEIPDPQEWEGEVKTLVIIDDIDFKGMSKEQKKNLNRLFGFVSTHKNISVALTSQDPFAVPPIVRRCANLWVLWRMSDLDAMSTVARRTGLRATDVKDIFKNLFRDAHESLWIDMTDKTPYAKRKNGFRLIRKKEDSEEEVNPKNSGLFEEEE